MLAGEVSAPFFLPGKEYATQSFIFKGVSKMAKIKADADRTGIVDADYKADAAAGSRKFYIRATEWEQLKQLLMQKALTELIEELK